MPDAQVDLKMQGAIFNGLFNLGAPVQYSCPTRNCRWDEFPTLAVGSSCRNFTEETHVECGMSAGLRDYYCNYTTPIGIKILVYQNANYNSSARSRMNSSIVEFAMTRMAEPFSIESPDVTECEMHWSGRIVRNMTITNGTFSPGIAEDFPLVQIREERCIVYNISERITSFSGNRTFGVDRMDASYVKRYLVTAFSFSESSPFQSALFNSSNFSETIAAISASMTYAIGQAPSGKKKSTDKSSSPSNIYKSTGHG
jgi:hypothetical protein